MNRDQTLYTKAKQLQDALDSGSVLKVQLLSLQGLCHYNFTNKTVTLTDAGSALLSSLGRYENRDVVLEPCDNTA